MLEGEHSDEDAVLLVIMVVMIVMTVLYGFFAQICDCIKLQNPVHSTVAFHFSPWIGNTRIS